MPLKEKIKIPNHVALIMDGNRRWAKERHLPEIEGHRRSVQRIKELVALAGEKGIKSMTFWAFSTENWSRGQSFLDGIFKVFRETLENQDFFEELKQKGGQIHILGDISKFPPDIVKRINKYLADPGPKNNRINVNLALNYGGRDELIRAFKKIVDQGFKSTEINVELVNEFLDTAGQPDVDLMIRTGGELRTSGYLLWQMNYAEFYFSQTYFPDFGRQEFEKAILEYAKRDRRFGGNSPKV